MFCRALAAVAVLLIPMSQPHAAPPNLVLIVADDLGHGEVGAQRVGDVPTPNIDAIARAG